jgi:hypothetical protein
MEFEDRHGRALVRTMPRITETRETNAVATELCPEPTGGTRAKPAENAQLLGSAVKV